MSHHSVCRAISLIAAVISIGDSSGAATNVDMARQPPSTVLDTIITSWNSKQLVHGNARWQYSGSTTYPKGSISSNPDYQPMLPEETSGIIPNQDHVSDLRLDLIMDFRGNRVRRRFNRNIFNLSEARFVPDVEIDICDGMFYANVAPRKENTSNAFAPAPHQPDIVLLGDKAPPLFFRPIDLPVLISHGIFPCAATPLVPTSLQTPHRSTTFRFVSIAEVAGSSIVVIATDTSSRPAQMTTEIWVNPDEDMLPIRIVNQRGLQEIGRYEISNVETAKGWRPASWSYRELKLDSSTLKSERVSVDRVEYDAELPSGVFSAVIEAGMVVKDRLNNTWYVNGDSTHPDRTVEELKALAD